jgi:hypothetical protein
MASTINTSIVKLRTFVMDVYLSKPMIMRIKPYVGISKIRRYRMEHVQGQKKI